MLPQRDRRDARAHDLGDERRGVEHQTQQQGEELGAECGAFLDLEIALLRQAPAGGRTPGQPAQHRQADDQCQRHQHHRFLLTRQVKVFAGLAGIQPGAHRAQQQSDERERLPQFPDRPGEGETALAQVEVADLPGFFEAGQDFGEDDVPDQQLQVDRHVAEELDIAVADLAQQQVGRKTPHADQRAEDRGQHDADQGNLERVEHADGEGRPVRAHHVVRDHGFADVETEGLAHEVVTALDAALAHVAQRVAHEQPDEGGHRGDGHHLVDDAAAFAAVPRNRASFFGG